MNQLVLLRGGRAITNSIIVHETFGKRHDNVIRDIENLKKDVLNFEEMFTTSFEYDSYGRKRKIYEMNRDGWVLLVMGFTGEKAMKFKLKYIKAFNKMEAELNKPKEGMLVLPQDYKSALVALVEQVERNEQLETVVQEQKPKVLFADAVSTSDTSILIGQLAKLITQNGHNIGQNRLFEWMRQNGYLGKSGQHYNEPTQYAMERGWFEVKERTVNNPDGSVRITRTTKVTGKGQVYFINKFLERQEVI